MNKHAIYITLFLIVALTSCDNRRKVWDRPDVLGESRVNIKIDWANLKTSDTPFDKMELHLYDTQGNHIVKPTDKNGYTGELPAGDYSLLVFNPEADNVLYEALESYGAAEVRIPSVGKSRAIEGEELFQPGNIYGCSMGKFTVTAGTVTDVAALLHPYVSILKIKIDLTGEVSRVVGCRVRISGIADRVNLSTSEVLSTRDEFIVISEDMIGTGFQTAISIFGTNANVNNIMEVGLTLDDGSTMVVDKDITEEIKDVNDPLSPNINIMPKIDLDTKMGKLTATIISWKVTGGNANVEE